MRTVLKRLSKLNKILFYKDWYTIAYRRCDKLAELEDLLYSEKLWTVLPFNKNEWYADPFLFENNGDIEVIDLMYSKFDICGMPKRLTGYIKHKFSKNE